MCTVCKDTLDGDKTQWIQRLRLRFDQDLLFVYRSKNSVTRCGTVCKETYSNISRIYRPIFKNVFVAEEEQ